MNLKEAEILFNAGVGVLQEPTIKHDEKNDGWIVTLAGTHKLNPNQGVGVVDILIKGGGADTN